ncbi:hypothetical protein SprV_0200960400 [Sparganum proliferum]
MEHIVCGVRINVEERTPDNYQQDVESSEPVYLYVSGVKTNITNRALREHFAQFGEVERVYLPRNPHTDWHCGNGYVILRPTWDMDIILDMEHIVCGVRITVEERTPENYQQDVESSDSNLTASRGGQQEDNSDLRCLLS